MLTLSTVMETRHQSKLEQQQAILHSKTNACQCTNLYAQPLSRKDVKPDLLDVRRALCVVLISTCSVSPYAHCSVLSLPRTRHHVSFLAISVASNELFEQQRHCGIFIWAPFAIFELFEQRCPRSCKQSQSRGVAGIKHHEVVAGRNACDLALDRRRPVGQGRVADSDAGQHQATQLLVGTQVGLPTDHRSGRRVLWQEFGTRAPLDV
mgnify:CR=1 FL=1